MAEHSLDLVCLRETDEGLRLSCNALSAGIISRNLGGVLPFIRDNNSAFVSSPTPSPLTSDDRHRALPAALVDNQITSKWYLETFEDKGWLRKSYNFAPPDQPFRLTTLLTHERNPSPF